MTNEQKWAERVVAWRASGLTSMEFSAGREFTAGGLRHWAYLLKRRASSSGAPPARARPALRIARVERLQPTPARPAEASGLPAAPASVAPPALMIELGSSRLSVPAGFDVTTLEVVLSALAAPVGRSNR